MGEVLTRQELYHLVWEEPLRTVAQRFSMSDVAFKKYCVRAGLPVPERGYWAKRAAGKAATKLPLPPRDPGASDLIDIGPRSYRGLPGIEDELAQPLPQPPAFDEPLKAVRARVGRRLGKVKNVRDLASPVGALRKALEDEAKRVERSSGQTYFWDKPIFESGFEKRRLRLLNSIGLGLARTGVNLHVRDKATREVAACVGCTWVSLSLDHPSAKLNRRGEWQTREGPSDTLRLVIGPEWEKAEGYQGLWEDSDDAKLEACLGEIVLEIIVAGEAEYRTAAHRNHARRLTRRAELERELEKRQQDAEGRAREARLAAERARREHLFSQAHAWRAAQDIRGFVAAVLASPSIDSSRADVKAWVGWALTEAEALDPTTPRNLSLPDEID